MDKQVLQKEIEQIENTIKLVQDNNLYEGENKYNVKWLEQELGFKKRDLGFMEDSLEVRERELKRVLKMSDKEFREWVFNKAEQLAQDVNDAKQNAIL